MTSHYYQQLDQASKDRYLDKLSFNGIVLPDPLDEAIRSYAFSPSVNLWPPVSFGDVYLYLVHNVCFYTQQEFKSYKALDSYNYVFSGKVKNIVTFRNTTVNVSVLTCDVQASQTLKNVHRPWVITSNDGVVYSAHCTCMAGLGEACSHIGALLFALEVFSRVGPPSSTSLPCQWNKCSKKVEPLAVSDIQFNHSRGNPNEKPSIDFQMPSASAFNSFLRVIQETSPDAPILKNKNNR